MRAELYLYGRYESCGADILIHTLLGVFSWLPSAHQPDEMRVIHIVDQSQIIVKTILEPSNEQCQHAVRTRVRPYWGSEWGIVWTRHKSQWGINTVSCEKQSPEQWGKTLCMLTLVLTRSWLWTSVCPQPHPHWALIMVLSTYCLWSSLGLHSCPHFALTLILTSAWLSSSFWTKISK